MFSYIQAVTESHRRQNVFILFYWVWDLKCDLKLISHYWAFLGILSTVFHTGD